MTNEEIEKARYYLTAFLDEVYNEAPELDTDEPMALINSLCDSATQLVGRRVRIKSDRTITRGLRTN